MLTLEPFDPSCPIDRQLETDRTPVVLVNAFSVDPADVEALIAAWEADAAWMKRQPGFISTQLHRGLPPSTMFLNYAVWESTAHFRAAFTDPDFQAGFAAYPGSAIAAPHLFQKVAAANLCTA